MGWLFSIALAGSLASGQIREIEGVTFADDPGRLFVPVREVAEALRLPFHWDDISHQVWIAHRKLETGERRALYDGTALADLGALRGVGLAVEWDQAARRRIVRFGGQEAALLEPEKRVVISKRALRLRAYQGSRLVMESTISVGKRGHDTPNGTFRAGPFKARMHRSSLYGNAPMPWSVQVTGHVFIHGWDGEVGGRSSHGCIRLPVDGDNPAKWFFEWVERGTPVTIADDWPAAR